MARTPEKNKSQTETFDFINETIEIETETYAVDTKENIS